MSHASGSAVSVRVQVSTMNWNFWVANIMEALERLAFFGVRAVLPLYMVAAKGQGIGPHDASPLGHWLTRANARPSVAKAAKAA